MDIRIVDRPLKLALHGVSGIVANNNYGETGFRLMDKIWRQIKANSIKNKGLNTWVYTGSQQMFVGVELQGEPESDTGLESKNIDLRKYAYFKHVGPYQQIKDAGTKVLAELKRQSISVGTIYIEVYGHWVQDDSLLETELIWELV